MLPSIVGAEPHLEPSVRPRKRLRGIELRRLHLSEPSSALPQSGERRAALLKRQAGRRAVCDVECEANRPVIRGSKRVRPGWPQRNTVFALGLAHEGLAIDPESDLPRLAGDVDDVGARQRS